MAKVSAAFLGTATACLLFLFCVDHVFVRRQPPVKLIDAPGHMILRQQNIEQRAEWWQMRLECVDAQCVTVKAIADAHTATMRANAAETKLASIESQLATERALADAGRRDRTRIPLLGDDEADRIPPQNVPVPIPGP